MVRQAVIATAVLAAMLAMPLDAESRRVALVVGANYGADHQVRLRHAERDAQRVARVFRELGGVSPDDVTLLVNKPTARQVLKTLKQVEQQALESIGPNETVTLYFYYSGHANGRHLQLSGTRLPIALLRDRLKYSKATLRVAILDACHSGTATRMKGGNRTQKKLRFAFSQTGSIAEGYAIITSSAAGEKSQESDEIRGSFFTHHLVSGLRGAADANGDDIVTLGEAYRYSYQKTLSETAKSVGTVQHPHFDMAIKGAQDVVLTQLAGAQCRVRVVGKQSARWVIFNPASGLVIAELGEYPGKTRTVAVPAAHLEVYRRSGESVARGEIDARKRTLVLLNDEILEPVPMTAYLYKGEHGFMVSAMVGLQSFAAGQIEENYMGDAPLFTLALHYRGMWLPQLGAVLDLSFTQTSRRMVLEEVPYDQHVTRFQVGLALPYSFDSGNFSVSVGPRVALLYTERTKELEGSTLGTDRVPMWVFGAATRLAWRLKAVPVSVGFEGRLSYVPVPTEEGMRDEMLVEAQVGAGFHF